MNNDLHSELESPEEAADRHFKDWESQKAKNIKGGMMDIQKQRESFEVEFKKTNFYKGMIESLKNKDCHFTSIFEMRNGEYRNIYINLSFEVWQQAQKVAVPDGYVVVPREPTKEMIEAHLRGKVILAYVGAYEKAAENYKKQYKAMIKAQEQVQ